MQVTVSMRPDDIVVLAWSGGVATIPAAHACLSAVPTPPPLECSSNDDPFREPPGNDWSVIDGHQRTLLSGLAPAKAVGIVDEVAVALRQPVRRRGALGRVVRVVLSGLAMVGLITIAFLGHTAYQAFQPLAVAELAPVGVNDEPVRPSPPSRLQTKETATVKPAPPRLGDAWLKASAGPSGKGVSPFGEGGPVIGGGNVGAGDLQTFGLKP